MVLQGSVRVDQAILQAATRKARKTIMHICAAFGGGVSCRGQGRVSDYDGKKHADC